MNVLKLILITLLLPISAFCNGLQFTGAKTISDPRCRYDVFYKIKPIFSSTLNIEFEIEIHNFHSLGNILEFQYGKNGEAIKLAYAYDNRIYSDIKFNTETQNIITHRLKNDTLGSGRWIAVALNIDLDRSEVNFLIGDKRYLIKDIKLKSTIKPKLIFGCSLPHEDAAAFSIRNFKVYNDYKNFEFPLNESSGNIVHDITQSNIGYVTNPTWKIVQFYEWEKLLEYEFDTNAAISYDMDDKLLMITKDTLFEFSLNNNTLTKEGYSNKIPMRMAMGMSIFDASENAIYIYEVNAMPYNATMISKLCFKDNKWSRISNECLPKQRHHHSAFMSKQNAEYVIFGGFGNRTYNNEFTSYSFSKNTWQDMSFEGDSITPRFFTSMIPISDTSTLLFGGKGNSAGDQTVGIEYFYDLYKVNLADRKITKLWQLDSITNKKLIPIRSGFLSKDTSSFYTMLYPERELNSSLQLYKFNIKDGGYENVGDTLPMISGNILSNANLFVCNNNSKIYCYTQIFDQNETNKSTISLFAINAPPVTIHQMNYYSEGFNKSLILWICLIVSGLITVFILRRLYKCNQDIIFSTTDEHSAPTIEQFQESVNIEKVHQERFSNTIYLYGEFTVYDRNAMNITHLFSTKIKQLFLLILFKSYDRSNGISSSEIQNILWADKTPSSGKNLRGVTMNHLRKALQDLDGIEIIYKNGRFKTLISNPAYCDYTASVEIVEQSIREGKINNEDLKILFQLLSRGSLLLGSNDEVFDKFRRRFDDVVTHYLPIEISHLYINQDYNMVLGFCTILFTIDHISEVALWYEIHSLLKLKKTDEAKHRFRIFGASYNKSMGEAYSSNYEKFISSIEPYRNDK